MQSLNHKFHFFTILKNGGLGEALKIYLINLFETNLKCLTREK